MAVVYSASTTNNVGADDSKIAYKQFFGDSQHLDFSVYGLRNNPFKVTTVCLGLLGLLLLAAVIGQGVHYKNKNQEHETTLKAMANDKETTQQNLRTALMAKKATETRLNDLQRMHDYVNSVQYHLQTNNNLLVEEAAKLKTAKATLETTNADLTKRLDEATKLKDEAESNSNALTTAKHLLQTQYDAVVKRRNELQQNYNSAVKERDNLQNKFNNVTRSREQLQMTYNDMIGKVEKLQDSYNVTSREKDKIESSHQNLTIYKDTLEATCAMVKKAEDELRASYDSLVKEKHEVESRLTEATAERDQLRAKTDNLTAQRDQLQEELQKLNATIQATNRQCQSGWQKFQNSCYYKSFSKKSWELGRQYCKNKQADLVVINSREEMVFVNKLYTGNTEVWIGLTDGGVEGEWKWVDGTDLTLTFWGKDQPNSHNGRNQDCVEIWHQTSGDGEWNDESCTIEQNFICEM
ncbi:C-type lectin domain family 4 member M-like [Salarias fasciatus]|uniref:C-type lectin domain family 4 member M-like n=1 Tax=Salarias fasciatus TaxID=181472 RepID=A0A672GT06_SALFA|nr:C-type lectin domain family 4 member M-like [Salarias fasciatus]